MFIAGQGRTRIDVRSVWFLLLYASDLVDRLTTAEKEMLLEGERDNDLLDALAEVLAAQTEKRVRSMLVRGYRSRTEPLTRVRGRIDHLGTARGRLMDSGKILCTFDEQTVDLPRYRYMLVTLRRAARRAESTAVRRRCLATAQMLERTGVSPIDPTAAEISKEQFGHFDAVDRKLLAVSRLVRQMCAPEHTIGTASLPAIARDEQALRRLFEAAVRGFYRHRLTPHGYSVGGASMEWPVEGDDDAQALMPRLNADVVIRGNVQQTVIECKFAPIFTQRYGKPMIDPAYVRQLYAYARVFGHMFDGHTRAVLLGALVEDSPGRDLDLTLDGIPFSVRQIDLAATPSRIREALSDAVTHDAVEDSPALTVPVFAP